MRDPRELPLCGDILRKGGIYMAVYFEALEHNPRQATTGVSFITDGRECQVSLLQWQKAMKYAEVIRKGKV